MAEGSQNNFEFFWDKSSEDCKIIYCDPCKYDNKMVDSEGYCINCEEYLCHSCLQSHKKFKAFRTHILLCGDSMPKEQNDGKKHTVFLYCDEHQTNEVKYYCFSHKVVYCRICQTTKHSTCNNRNISEVCNIESDKLKLQTALSNIEAVKESFDIRKKAEETKIDEMNESKKTYKADLKLLHSRMRIILEKLEEEINREDLNTESVMNELQERIAVSTDVLNHISSVCNDVNQAMMSDDPPTIFAALIKLLNVTSEYKDIDSNIGQGTSLLVPSNPSTVFSQLMELLEKFSECWKNLKYAEQTVLSPQIKNESTSPLLDQKSQQKESPVDSGNTGEKQKQYPVAKDKIAMPSFGGMVMPMNVDKLMDSSIENAMLKDVSSTHKSTTPQVKDAVPDKQQEPKKTNEEIKKNELENLNVISRSTKTIQTDTNKPTCDITGCLFLKNGELILCDVSNSKIILLDTDLNICDELKLDGNVWDVAQVNKHEVVVSLMRTKKLAFVTMEKSKFDHVSRMDLRRVPWGVACYDNNIIVSYHNNPGNGVIEIRQKGGKIVKQFTSLVGTELITPFYLALDKSLRCLYISDSKQNCIICMNLDGKYLGKIKNDDLKWPRKVILGENKSVAVCSSYSDSIICFKDQIGQSSENRWLSKQLISIKGPQAATMRWSDMTMVVTKSKSNLIRVLKCEV